MAEAISANARGVVSAVQVRRINATRCVYVAYNIILRKNKRDRMVQVRRSGSVRPRNVVPPEPRSERANAGGVDVVESIVLLGRVSHSVGNTERAGISVIDLQLRA